MNVTSITVTRKRSKQPEQFGNATAEITVHSEIDAGDDWEKTARSLLVTTRALVYENLGLKLPASAGAKETQTPTETATVEVETTEDKPATAKPGKKPRGRPRKSAPSDDLPGVADDGDSVSEADDPGDTASDDVGAETEDSSDGPMTQSDLQGWLVEQINGKNIKIGDARKIMVDLTGFIKSSDLADDQVQEVFDAVRASIAAGD